jgi:hypothetical protein
MVSKTQAQSLFISLDFIASLAIAVAIAIFVPEKLKLEFTKDIFEVAIAVLSIVFSVYFAALAVVITSGDNEFIDFLEEEGAYSHIIWTFKITLLLLFVALMISILLFVIVLPFADFEIAKMWFPNWGLALYALIALWSLFAAAMATLDAITYAEYRARFIMIMRDKDSD